MATTITTFSGKSFDFENPQPDMIAIEDIAHHLGNVCRFAGATGVHYSVAQHSIMVAGLACEMVTLPERQPEVGLYGLLHDASEAYLGDVPTPWKQVVGMESYRQMEERTMRAIGEALGLDLTKLPEEVKKADRDAFFREQAYLMRPPHNADNPYTGSGIRFGILAPQDASQAWYITYMKLKEANGPKIILATS